eukprot:2875231-Pyramimonas_sp.AAC.1
MYVQFALAKGAPDALDALVDGILSAGHMDIINMLGSEKGTACLEFLVAGRGSETKVSRGPSELQ